MVTWMATSLAYVLVKLVHAAARLRPCVDIWILMSAGRSYSGHTKLVSPSWLDGAALGRIRIAGPYPM